MSKNEDAPTGLRFQRWVRDSKFESNEEQRYTGPQKDLTIGTRVNDRLDRKVMKKLLKDKE